MLKRCFGASAVADRAEVKLVIRMVPLKEMRNITVSEMKHNAILKILGVLVPTIVIPVSAGRNNLYIS